MRANYVLCILLLCCGLACGACASKNATEPSSSKELGTATVPPSEESVRPHPQEAAAVLDDYDMQTRTSSNGADLDDYDATPHQSIADPLEPWNRFWFGFNDFFYLNIASPLYKGYDAVMPDEFQSGLRNFLSNILFPVRFVNALLQGKFQAAGVEYGRFIINTFVGFGGFIDVAKGAKTVVPVDPAGEDLGQTLGYWGIGDGFYIVWPFLGPSSLRDTIGLGGDTFLNPTWYIPSTLISFGVNGTLRFNSLGEILPLYTDLKDIAVDPYIGMREAYTSFRRQHIAQ